jgi:hypothetical protein
VNSDGKVDVSDAIAVVQFLFLGEPELLQPQCPTGLPPGVHTPGRFVDNGDGTVTDTATRLMWEQNTGPSRRSWQDAIHYCDALTLAGHDDWRLPEIWELFSLIQFETPDTMDPAFDFDQGNNGYWSITTALGEDSAGRCVVDFTQTPSNGRVFSGTILLGFAQCGRRSSRLLVGSDVGNAHFHFVAERDSSRAIPLAHNCPGGQAFIPVRLASFCFLWQR